MVRSFFERPQVRIRNVRLIKLWLFVAVPIRVATGAVHCHVRLGGQQKPRLCLTRACLPWPVLIGRICTFFVVENTLSAELPFGHVFHRKQVKQEGALGLLKNLKQDGYALTCCSYPKSDLVLQLQEEDDVSRCCCFACPLSTAFPLPLTNLKSLACVC